MTIFQQLHFLDPTFEVLLVRLHLIILISFVNHVLIELWIQIVSLFVSNIIDFLDFRQSIRPAPPAIFLELVDIL